MWDISCATSIDVCAGAVKGCERSFIIRTQQFQLEKVRGKKFLIAKAVISKYFVHSKHYTHIIHSSGWCSYDPYSSSFYVPVVITLTK
jgi:hypothetical protein